MFGGGESRPSGMTNYLILKYAHIVGATVLLGTGLGIAFFMLLAHRTRSVATIAAVARIVVLADFVFTAPAVVLQLITGVRLAQILGYPLMSGWVGLSLVLYVLIGAFWIPVVWMQMRMHILAVGAVRMGAPLPRAYHRLFRVWFVFGIPAFSAVLIIIWLMIARPPL